MKCRHTLIASAEGLIFLSCIILYGKEALAAGLVLQVTPVYTQGTTFMSLTITNGRSSNFYQVHSFGAVDTARTYGRVKAHCGVTNFQIEVRRWPSCLFYKAFELPATPKPLFQYGSFYNKSVEVTSDTNKIVTGAVYVNGDLYIRNYSSNTPVFQSSVSVTGNWFGVFTTSNSPGHYDEVISRELNMGNDPPVTMLPGGDNSPRFLQAIAGMPPEDEEPESVVGRLRYYNKADLIVLIKDTGVEVTSGRFDNFATSVPWAEASLFIQTGASFYDNREKRIVSVTDLDLDKLRRWNWTNSVLKPALPNVRVLYVGDLRESSSNLLYAVRLVNGQCLPPEGLTVASCNPVYIKGDFNVCTNASFSATEEAVPVNLMTNDTSQTRPAAIAGDAITILSSNWVDSTTVGYTPGAGREVTVNAALLTGFSTNAFVRRDVDKMFGVLEDWRLYKGFFSYGYKSFTHNGSRVVLFQSKYATAWDSAYPPLCNSSFDVNFLDASKLPPATPVGFVCYEPAATNAVPAGPQ